MAAMGGKEWVHMDHSAVGYSNGSFYFKGSDCAATDDTPMIGVTWYGAVAFTEWLSELTGKTFRLPTEAEWEYAARGGERYKYAGSNDIDDVAWYGDNSGRKTHPVGQKRPNGYGLYDMSGNVLEWCADWYDDYTSSPQTDPVGPSSGQEKILRGGSWIIDAQDCRVANRGTYTPDGSYFTSGFRVVVP